MKQMITLKIHKKAISESEYIKYLGIMVDSTLSWNRFKVFVSFTWYILYITVVFCLHKKCFACICVLTETRNDPKPTKTTQKLKIYIFF